MGAWVTYGIGQRECGFARLRRHALRPEPARWRPLLLGQRFPADGLSGRGVPAVGRSGSVPLQSRGRDRRNAPPLARCPAVSQLTRIRPTSAIPKSPRASAPMRWRTRCKPACPSWPISQRSRPDIHEMYGTTPGKASFANNCLLARRLVERGVRFVQLYHRGWDTTAPVTTKTS